MRELTKLDQALSEPKSVPELEALFAATLPADVKTKVATEANWACYCSTTVMFVIYYLADKAAADKINEINSFRVGGTPTGKAMPGCLILNDSAAASCLQHILSLSGNYFVLLSSLGNLSHACCFASYGLGSPTRTWGFYQSNSGAPQFTVSPSVNKAKGMRDGNRLAMDKKALSDFFPTITTGGLPVFGADIKTWALKVVSFEGKEIYP